MSSPPEDPPSAGDAADLTDVGDFQRTRGVAAEAAAMPRQIGRYRVLEVIGRGGMGTVFLAEQVEPIRRQVAVKVIRSAIADTHTAYRFEAERQALARMSHPCIAQVYEAGDTEAGQPFFAMEYIPGEPITDYCDRACLTLDQRLDLFTAVCGGIHHAHQKGILHRDIKPQNVLVATEQGKPVPKIIDFGIAKALDEAHGGAGLTAHGMVVGTPSYLSPELVAADRADPDTRSDVYSLGVLLFELLTGTRPFGRPGDSFVQVVRQVAGGEVPAPSARWKALSESQRGKRATRRGTTPAGIARRLRGDLDWITLKATARERERRYDSAAELAADVERHRRIEPVEAGPPHRLYVLGKFLRRYRSAVVATALVVATLAAGVAARTLEARRANREAAAARQAQTEAQQVVDFLIELFEVNDPGTARGNTVTARELLDRGAEKIRSRLADQPLSRARLLDTIGVVYRRMDLPEPAKPLLQKALEIREDQLGPNHPDVATSLDHLGEVDWLGGDYAAAQAALERALAIREKAFGPDDLSVAAALDDLGSVLVSQGEFKTAEPVLRRALAIREKALGPDDLLVAASLDDLGVLTLDRFDPAVAEPLLRRALAIREARLGADHPEVAVSANGLGICLYRLHRDAESAEVLSRALAIREKVFGPESAPVAQTLNNLSNPYLELGRQDEAEAAMVRAGAIFEKVLGPGHPRVGLVFTNLADFYLRRGDTRAAEALFRRAVGVLETALGPDHPNVSFPLRGLAESLHRQGRLVEGAVPCRRALAIREKAFGPDDGMTTSLEKDCAGWFGAAPPAS